MADTTRPPQAADLQFSYSIERDGAVSRLVLAGEIDLNVAPVVQQAIIEALTLDPPDRVDVDLARLTFLDSRGLSALIAGRRTADAQGRGYRVVNPSGAVLRTLEITALLPYLNGTPDGTPPDGDSPAGGSPDGGSLDGAAVRSADQDGAEPLDGAGR